MLGETLGNYRVLHKLGEGGMGTVYLAEHKLIGRKAAVKVLLPEFLQQKDIVDRFFIEARATTGIHHPGIVQVLDFGHHKDGHVYLVMEYLQGEPLDRRLKRQRKLPVLQAVRIAYHCASALAAAHTAGVIHRDLKPGNIYLVPDPQVEGGERAKILDFGIAKLTGERQTSLVKTRTGSMVGTPVYMSPEQCRGAGEVDHRSDIYALGCVLFRLICGRPPFVARGVGDIIASHLREPAPSAREFEPNVPVELEALIAKTLAKSPDDRHGSMGELATELKALAQLPSIMDAGMSASVPELPLEVSFGLEQESIERGPLSVAGDDESAPGQANESGHGRSEVWSSARPPQLATRQLRAPSAPVEPAGPAVVADEDSLTISLPGKTTLGGAASQRLSTTRRAHRTGIALVAVAAAGLAAGAVVFIKSRTGTAPANGAALASGTAAAVAPRPATRARPGSGAQTDDDPAPAPLVLPLPEVETEPSAGTITIMIESEPSGADVYVGGRVLGRTPHAYKAEAGPGQIIVELRRAGYQDQTLSLSAERDSTFRATLRASKPKKRARKKRPKNKPVLDDALMTR